MEIFYVIFVLDSLFAFLSMFMMMTPGEEDNGVMMFAISCIVLIVTMIIYNTMVGG